MGNKGLFQEAKVLSQLAHPNIIRLHGIVPHGGVAIVLERLVCTLQTMLARWNVRLKQQDGLRSLVVPGSRQQRRLDFFQLRLSHARDIASAMAYLHGLSIVHRDLKSSNIGFAHDGKVKIFDFGQSEKLAAHHGFLKSMNGSARYMAPEVAAGRAYTDTCDVYSFTIVLWEMMTCERAFAFAKSSDAMLEWRIANQDERPHSQIGCHKICEIYLAVPFLTKGNHTGAALYSIPFTDTIIDFKQMTDIDIGIIHVEKPNNSSEQNFLPQSRNRMYKIISFFKSNIGISKKQD